METNDGPVRVVESPRSRRNRLRREWRENRTQAQHWADHAVQASRRAYQVEAVARQPVEEARGTLRHMMERMDVQFRASDEAAERLLEAVEGKSECLPVKVDAEAVERADGCSHVEEHASVEEGVDSSSEENDFQLPGQGHRTSAIDEGEKNYTCSQISCLAAIEADPRIFKYLNRNNGIKRDYLVFNSGLVEDLPSLGDIKTKDRKPFHGLLAFVFGVVVKLERRIRVLPTVLLQAFYQILFQNLAVELCVHPPINQGQIHWPFPEQIAPYHHQI
ncbi:hypothetical protein PsorP6_006106 [Peronosclerospora sorghi]|uniref:Uncharacterized protein n=1 Tax=Peronosclerospora sorghi TaxID=230839 RepID=A0ACC0W386_9STRA|nr:hypothetical protein PsorP6_006106 [Peronosclerospora sorghi]